MDTDNERIAAALVRHMLAGDVESVAKLTADTVGAVDPNSPAMVLARSALAYAGRVVGDLAAAYNVPELQVVDAHIRHMVEGG